MAAIRKQGMDVLMPQDLHDNVIACIFSALTCCDQLAHRDLIEMIIEAQKGLFSSQLAGVTKTKVRGILAILKHAGWSHSLGNMHFP